MEEAGNVIWKTVNDLQTLADLMKGRDAGQPLDALSVQSIGEHLQVLAERLMDASDHIAG